MVVVVIVGMCVPEREREMNGKSGRMHTVHTYPLSLPPAATFCPYPYPYSYP